jgi:hypothetical protein
MLVLLTDRQVLSTKAVCSGCLMADQSGQPRWQQGQLRCGHALSRLDSHEPTQYECQMGFRVANIT